MNVTDFVVIKRADLGSKSYEKKTKIANQGLDRNWTLNSWLKCNCPVVFMSWIRSWALLIFSYQYKKKRERWIMLLVLGPYHLSNFLFFKKTSRKKSTVTSLNFTKMKTVPLYLLVTSRRMTCTSNIIEHQYNHKKN